MIDIPCLPPEGGPSDKQVGVESEVVDSRLLFERRSKSELVSENALLRQPLLILKRQVKRPTCTQTDRILLVLLARLVRTWQQALVIVQPDTLLRWHRELFRLFWKRKSKAPDHKPKVAADTIALIRQMAKDNRRLRCRAHS